MRESGSVTRLRSLGQGHSTRSKVTPRLAIKYTKNKQLFLFAIDGSGGSRISLRRARQPKKPNFPENYMIMKKIGPGGEFAGLPLRIVLRGGSNYLKTTAWTISFPGWGVGWEGGWRERPLGSATETWWFEAFQRHNIIKLLCSNYDRKIYQSKK